MKRFLTTIGIFLIVALGCTAIVWRYLAMQVNRYCIYSPEVNVVRQIERLDTLSSPKILIIGGSGCALGICSPMIKEHYGMEVSNTGTHAGLGLRMQIKLFEDYIHQGDIVIVIPEYEQFTEIYFGNESALRILASTYPNGFRKFSVLQQLSLFGYVPQAYQDAMKVNDMDFSDRKPPYMKESLNEFGDVEGYEFRAHESRTWKNNEMKKNVKFLPICCLKELQNKCIANNAKLFIFPPAFRDGAYDHNEEIISKIWKKLKQNDLPVVGNPIDYRMTTSLFYDTNYHLTYEGTMYRTGKLILDLDSINAISE